MKKLLFASIMFATVCFSSVANAQTRSLVVYFSHSGNTESVAQQIKTFTGADILEIIPEKAYPEDYQSVVDQSKAEINAGIKPAIKPCITDIARYDTVFIGSPCWWATIAPPVATFLSEHNLSGKTIVPFMTHEGSRMGHSEKEIRELCPESVLLQGLPIRGSKARQAAPEIKKWLQEIGVTQH